MAVSGQVGVTEIYSIGPFLLDAQAGVLTHAGMPVPLGVRGVAVLSTLVRHANDYVSKASILDAAWPGVVVEESNLAVQISAIRHVFARVAGGERWIETLARRGYRFVGPVSAIDHRQSTGPVQARGRSNLPEALTSFIGRERELAQIKRLLPGKRLLTLAGVGGIGKTRLALQACAEVIDAYRDGVWLVELASIADPLLVPATVAQALGVAERTGTALTETLCAYLKARQVLVILDNCEHLLDACAALADAFLRAAAHVTIMATSREPLHVVGEQTLALPTLSLPDPTASPEAIASSEAVLLFVERAQRQQPDFALTAAHAPVIAQLCVHLDGIPLAVELAAARIRSLSVEQINARIVDRFKLLNAGSRTALPRQQTLRATFDWSFDLLDASERALLRRLAIFAGGFTLEAASSVASDATIDEYAVVDVLSQLVERSLVVADTRDSGARYRLLETTRAYALDKLAEAGETDLIRRRHAQYFRRRFEAAADDWMRLPDTEWHAIYPPERDNVRAALDWAFGAGGEAAIGVALAGAVGWGAFSLNVEGVERLKAAIARVDSQTPESEHARLWLWLGTLLTTAMPVQAVAAFEQAIALYRRAGDPLGLGISLARLGGELAIMGRHKETPPFLEEAFPLLERAGVPKALALCFNYMGVVAVRTGDLADARRHYEKALSLFRDAKADIEVLRLLGNIADLSWVLGDLDSAAERFRETVARLRKAPQTNRTPFGFNLTNLAGVLIERGEIEEALAAAREGLPVLRDGGRAWIFMDHLALRAALVGKLANAARLSAYADSAYAAKQTSRQPNETRARDRLQALLQEKIAPAELASLLAEGATMSEDDACEMALEE
jgi:predicted ATPase/DNA-binding winged helix-turn-helix (wHTH) protein